MIDAVVNYYGKIDAPITNKQVLITTGGSEALQIALSCILDEGDEIIIPEPFYPNYSTFVTLTGATIRPITTTPEENYKFAIRERVEACINEHTRAILFTNPGNPTGTILTEEELRLMADIAKEHNLFIIGDEVYREFVYGGEKLMSLLQLKGYEDNVVVIDSVSKRFSACGARIGCVITRNAELYNNAMKWCQGRLCASTIDQVASAALYTVGPEYFDAVRKEYKARRGTLVEGLKKIPGVIYSEPKGAFYVMAKLPVDDAEKFQLFMLEEFDDNGDTLMFTPAESFYKTPHTGVNEIRMAYVINQDALKRSMELLAQGHRSLQQQISCIRKSRPLPIGNGRFLYWISFAFCRRLRLSSTTAESTHTQPRALSGVSFSWNTKMPTSVATTGSNDARMDALPVSSPVRP